MELWSQNEAKDRLQNGLLRFSFFNLLVVSLLGVLLRAAPFLESLPVTYQNLLHEHSHFAFGGWVLPVLLSLLMKAFPEVTQTVAYRHWRNIAALVLLSAYGMLFSFPVQGYQAVSISFSTLSIVATVYLAVVVWQAAEKQAQPTSVRFLKWGLLYACLSALGPFATGPLVAMGKSGQPIYFDAIYFYLHLQYNGFFTFVVLGLLYRMMEQRGAGGGTTAFRLLNLACLPAYALSVLWSQPSVVFNLVGAVAGGLQLAGVFFLFRDVRKSRLAQNSMLLQLALVAFLIKNVLQLLSASPAVAALAYQNRNFVIAYLHLVLLGFISLFVFAVSIQTNRVSRLGIGAFLFSFITTELLLVLNASAGFLRFDVPWFAQLLLVCSLFFPVGIFSLLVSLRGKKNPVRHTHRQPALVS